MNFKQVDDLAAVWCEYGEMELRHENYDQALRILRVRHSYHKKHACLTFSLHNLSSSLFMKKKTLVSLN